MDNRIIDLRKPMNSRHNVFFLHQDQELLLLCDDKLTNVVKVHHNPMNMTGNFIKEDLYHYRYKPSPIFINASERTITLLAHFSTIGSKESVGGDQIYIYGERESDCRRIQVLTVVDPKFCAAMVTATCVLEVVLPFKYKGKVNFMSAPDTMKYFELLRMDVISPDTLICRDKNDTFGINRWFLKLWQTHLFFRVKENLLQSIKENKNKFISAGAIEISTHEGPKVIYPTIFNGEKQTQEIESAISEQHSHKIDELANTYGMRTGFFYDEYNIHAQKTTHIEILASSGQQIIKIPEVNPFLCKKWQACVIPSYSGILKMSVVELDSNTVNLTIYQRFLIKEFNESRPNSGFFQLGFLQLKAENQTRNIPVYLVSKFGIVDPAVANCTKPGGIYVPNEHSSCHHVSRFKEKKPEPKIVEFEMMKCEYLEDGEKLINPDKNVNMVLSGDDVVNIIYPENDTKIYLRANQVLNIKMKRENHEEHWRIASCPSFCETVSSEYIGVSNFRINFVKSKFIKSTIYEAMLVIEVNTRGKHKFIKFTLVVEG